MIWFFERPGERLQCEIRQSAHGHFYELVWTSHDGRSHIEQSHDPSELMQRRREIEQWLKLDGWIRPGHVTPKKHNTRPQSEWQKRKTEMH